MSKSSKSACINLYFSLLSCEHKAAVHKVTTRCQSPQTETPSEKSLSVHSGVFSTSCRWANGGLENEPVTKKKKLFSVFLSMNHSRSRTNSEKLSDAYFWCANCPHQMGISPCYFCVLESLCGLAPPPRRFLLPCLGSWLAQRSSWRPGVWYPSVHLSSGEAESRIQIQGSFRVTVRESKPSPGSRGSHESRTEL